MAYFCPILMVLPSICCENQHNNRFPVVNSMKAAVVPCPRLHNFSFALSLIICGSWPCLEVEIPCNLCLNCSELFCVGFFLDICIEVVFFFLEKTLDKEFTIYLPALCLPSVTVVLCITFLDLNAVKNTS